MFQKTQNDGLKIMQISSLKTEKKIIALKLRSIRGSSFSYENNVGPQRLLYTLSTG
jgi:hypothetical protein